MQRNEENRVYISLPRNCEMGAKEICDVLQKTLTEFAIHHTIRGYWLIDNPETTEKPVLYPTQYEHSRVELHKKVLIRMEKDLKEKLYKAALRDRMSMARWAHCAIYFHMLKGTENG